MPGWDGAGNFTVTHDFTDDRDGGIKILASRMDQNMTDLIGGMENCLTLDGQNSPTAALDFGGQKITDLGDGAALTDAATLKQAQNSYGRYAVATGSAGAYLLSLTPTPSAYATGQSFLMKANHTNTGAATINVNSLGVKDIKKNTGSLALSGGEIQSGQVYELVYDGTNFQLVGAVTLGKQTVWIPAAAMLAASTSGAASGQYESSSNKVNIKVLDFDGAADEYAHFQIAMPKGWNEGTVTYQVFWFSTGTDTDAVVWGLQGMALSDNEAIDASWGTAVTVTDNLQSAAGEVYVSAESSAVTIGGTPAEGDIAAFRFFRDADNGSDTAAEDARLIGIKLFITLNAATDD